MAAQATIEYAVLGTFVLLGAIAGGFIGARGSCETGACPLTSNPWMGAIYGGLVAGLFGLAVSGAQTGGTCPLTGSGAGGGDTQPAQSAAPELEQIEGQEAFQSAIDSEPRVDAVVFTADWCGICKSYLPEFRQVAADLEESAGFYEVDVDAAMPLARRLSIRGVPTTVIVKDGEVQERFTGRVAEKRLRGAIKKLLVEQDGAT